MADFMYDYLISYDVPIGCTENATRAASDIKNRIESFIYKHRLSDQFRSFRVASESEGLVEMRCTYGLARMLQGSGIPGLNKVEIDERPGPSSGRMLPRQIAKYLPN